jgi:GDP-4-dehydro-6-deoxy-D-mannose reductase
MSVLVTGGTGSLGYHLLSVITQTKGSLCSFSPKPGKTYRKLNHVDYEYGDLMDFNSILAIIEKYQPSEIYHIASQSNVGISHKKPFETLSTNFLGTQNLLEAVRRVTPKSKVLLLSSSDIYGPGEGLLDVFHNEDDPYRPITPFATSKACMEILGEQFARAWGMHILIARPFNFTGPYHSRRFVLPNIASQLIKIVEYGGEPVIYTGNLDVSRDVIDFRDLARALVLLMNTAKSMSVYNICSGQIRTIRELVEIMIEYSEMDIEIRRDPNRERKIDLPLLMGSPEKIMKATGWRPMIAIEDTIADIYHEMSVRIENEMISDCSD